jgi:hypothetical protein
LKKVLDKVFPAKTYIRGIVFDLCQKPPEAPLIVLFFEIFMPQPPGTSGEK